MVLEAVSRKETRLLPWAVWLGSVKAIVSGGFSSLRQDVLR